MADEYDDTNDDFDMSQLEPYDEEEDAQERAKDEEVAKQTKTVHQLAERQARMEAQLERDKLINEFYAKASDEAKEYADVLLAGVADPKKVKKFLDLAEAKAAKTTDKTTEESAEEKEQSEVANFAAPPLGNAPPEVRDVGKETKERTRKGEAQAAWWEFLAAPAKGGPEAR